MLSSVCLRTKHTKMDTKFETLSSEIDKLENNILELKKKRARCSNFPPIKFTKGQTTLRLKTEKGSDWVFEDIKPKKMVSIITLPM